MKQKKMILMISVILVALLVALGIWRPWRSTSENNPSDNIVDDQNDSSENGSSVDVEPSDQDDSTESPIVVLEDEGEIIIEIPDDQDSDGF